MATEGQRAVIIGFVANSDLTGAQFKLVKLTADRTVDLCTATTDKAIGVLQNKPKAGQTAEVMIVGETKIWTGAALAANALIGVDTSSRAVALTPGSSHSKYSFGSMIAQTGAADGIGTAVIGCDNPGWLV